MGDGLSNDGGHLMVVMGGVGSVITLKIIGDEGI